MKTIPNSIQLIGNLGRDPEITKTSNGAMLAKVSLATSEYYKDAEGKSVNNTQWHNLVAWGPQAEFMEKNLHKGDLVGVRGKIRNRSFTGSDGLQQYRTEIIVKEISTVPRRAQEAA